MREKIKPSLVLMIICIASSLLLVLAHEATKENIANKKVSDKRRGSFRRM